MSFLQLAAGLLLIMFAAVSFVLAICSLIFMSLNRRPGIPWRRPNGSPFNIMARPHELAPAGLKWRKLIVFFSGLALLLMLAGMYLLGAFN